ncbi:hypothetical protein EON65_15745 [archaeon]|nr:MAG: hypothetical protein EON65_15745 [archaeon]
MKAVLTTHYCLTYLEAIGEGILYRKVGKGSPASSGAVSGMLVFSTMDAIECRRKGVDCILCLPQTSPNDIGGLQVSLF